MALATKDEDETEELLHTLLELVNGMVKKQEYDVSQNKISMSFPDSI